MTSKSKQALTVYRFQLGLRFNGARCCHRSFGFGFGFGYVYGSPSTGRRPPIRPLKLAFSHFCSDAQHHESTLGNYRYALTYQVF
jgi:hypothetical protein